MREWLASLKLWTNGKKTLTAILGLVMAALQTVDVAQLTALSPQEWGKIVTLGLLGVLGVYGYEDAKKRIREEVTK